VAATSKREEKYYTSPFRPAPGSTHFQTPSQSSTYHSKMVRIVGVAAAMLLGVASVTAFGDTQETAPPSTVLQETAPPSPIPSAPPLADTDVSCGNHNAASCALCPEGNGATWCNGECEWDAVAAECVMPVSTGSCGECVDAPGRISGETWTDGTNGCSVYEANPDWCDLYGGTDYSGEGSAQDACCTCCSQLPWSQQRTRCMLHGGGVVSEYSISPSTGTGTCV
jgi:hypothetical protein